MRVRLLFWLLALFVAVTPGWLAAQATAPAPAVDTHKGESRPQVEGQATESSTNQANEPYIATIDFGYRWIPSQGGNFQMYRTMENYGEGPKFFGGHASLGRLKPKLWDRFDIDSTAWGDEPTSAVHASVEKAGVYDLSFQYRQMAFFSDIPGFANPLFGIGSRISQNALDFRHRLGDFDFTLFPNRRISPFFSYSRSRRIGPAYWPWIGPGNEYLSSATIDDANNMYRGGANFNFSWVNFTLEIGGTTYDQNERVYYGPGGPNPGNRRTPLFGTRMFVTELDQRYAVTGDMKYVRGSIDLHPVRWFDFSGQYSFAEPESKVSFTETAAGVLVSPTRPQKFTGVGSTAAASAVQPRPAGNVALEIRPFHRLRIIDSFNTLRFHNSGGSSFLQTLTGVTGLLGTTPPSTINTSTFGFRIFTNDYNRHETQAIVEAFHWLTLRAGYRVEWGQLTFIEPTEESGEVAFEADRHKQQRNVAMAGVTVRAPHNLSFTLDTEVANGLSTYVRTELRDYYKVKIGGRYQPRNWLRINLKHVTLRNTNGQPDIGYDFANRETGAGITLSPGGGRRVNISADYTYQTLFSNIGILLPPFYDVSSNPYRSSGAYAGAFVDFNLFRGAHLNFGGTMLVNHGTWASSYYQPRAELFVPLVKHVGWLNDWRFFDYARHSSGCPLADNCVNTGPTGGQNFGIDNFRAHLFATGLRLTF